MGGRAGRAMAISKRLRFKIFWRDGFRCRYCGMTAESSPLEVDHIIALANGGTDMEENLTTSCFACNRGKSDLDLDLGADDFIESLRIASMKTVEDLSRASARGERRYISLLADDAQSCIRVCRRFMCSDSFSNLILECRDVSRSARSGLGE